MMADTKTTKTCDDEEPDYMSDDFLAKCVPNDVRPGLLYKQGEKRKHELLKKQSVVQASNKELFKPHRILEKEARDAGLNRQITSENKGFQLLAKMGYLPGASIGKTSYSESQTLKEPIPLEIKVDRVGLGKKTLDKERMINIRQNAAKKRADYDKLADPVEFRRRKQASAALKDIEWDLKKAKSACQTLDQGKEINCPFEPWFWPKVRKLKPLASSESDDEEYGETSSKRKRYEEKPAHLPEESDEEFDVDEESHYPPHDEQLKQIMAYLKKSYFYCIWCGTSYDSEEQLRLSCPGESRGDH